MKINESTTDRVLRVIAGLVLLAVWAFGWVAGGLGIVFAIVGAILAITGAAGFCLLYRLFGVSTAPRKRS